jgi:hypothetical protein
MREGIILWEIPGVASALQTYPGLLSVAPMGLQFGFVKISEIRVKPIHFSKNRLSGCQ